MFKTNFRNNEQGSVRQIIIRGVFWRILIIEGILLVGTLAYAALFESKGNIELFWYAVRILLLVGIIIGFMTITLQSFLKDKIIIPLEAIAEANRIRRISGNPQGEDLEIDQAHLPKEIREIVFTRNEMINALLKVSEERLQLVEFIKNTFGRYLSSKVVDEILASPEGRKIGGRVETVTVLMSDLRGFTALSEMTDPEDLVEVLNRYLEEMSKVIVEFDGMIDEFIGDAILTVFGVPESREDDPVRAVACAIAMQNRLAGLNRELSEKGFPDLEMGIGINTGPAIVGNIGSEIRTKYGIVGPTINIASRIGSNTVGGEVLIGETTYEAAGDLVDVTKPQTIMMKGIRQPLVFYSATAVKGIWNVCLMPAEKQEGAAISLPFTCWQMDGKKQTGLPLTGETVRIGEQEITARIDALLDPRSSLKLIFGFCIEAHCFSDVYLTVLQAPELREKGLNRLRITSITEKDRMILKKWINGAM